MAVDRHWRCYVSPAFVAATPLEELAGAWVHEVSHLLRDHHGRGDRYAKRNSLTGPAERLRMNIAGDLEINDDVYGDGLTAPSGIARPDRLTLPRNLLMEEYLGMFRLGPYTDGLSWLDCGSGADGAARVWDLGPDGAHGLSDQERDAVRFRVAEGITGHPGTAPQGWRRWAEEVFHPPQPWRELLGAAVRAAASGPGAGNDYTHGRPSRRATALPGVVLPALRRRQPRVSVLIDTSGSVSDAELGSALALARRRSAPSHASLGPAASTRRHLRVRHCGFLRGLRSVRHVPRSGDGRSMGGGTAGEAGRCVRRGTART